MADLPEGVRALRALRDRAGVRLLVSSRASLPSVMGTPIALDRLPADAALQLFRELWGGNDALPADAVLLRFVVDDLGAHALSLTLVAHLGDCYRYDELVQRWQRAVQQ